MTTGEKQGLLARLGVLLRFLGGLIAFVFMLIFGALFLAAGVYTLGATSSHFEPLEATVLSARPVIGAVGTSGRNSWSVSVSLTYRYEIDGSSYPGQGTLDLGRAGSPGEAEQRAAAATARYAPGARFDAFVDPDDPARSVPERRGAAWAVPALAFGATILVIAMGIAVGSLRDWWRRRRGVAIDSVAAERAFERWLAGIATVLLVVFFLAAVAIGFEREPVAWAVLLGILAVLVVAILLDRRHCSRRPREHPSND